MFEKIALSTSLSYKHNWDPIYSLELTRRFGINNIQIYLGDPVLTQKIIREYSGGFNFIFHSPVDLNFDALNSKTVQIIPGIKNVVYHHDLSCNLSDSLDIIKKLNSVGITVLLENFYSEPDLVINNIKSYIDILNESVKRGLKVYPLIDIPRLFIQDISNKYDSMELTLGLLDSIHNLDVRLYLHLIDVDNISQSRETWCPIGTGIIPYKKIFIYITSLEIDIPMIVLEFEEEKHIGESLDFLNKNPIKT